MGKMDIIKNVFEHNTSYGLPVTYIKKPEMRTFYLYILVNYGSQELEYVDPRDKDIKHIIPGTAHFLEHKIFESEDRNTFQQFSSQGASVNAYTGFSSTVYYFSCTRSISDNIKLMMDTISTTFINHETVEKEKGIIIQEIKMYYDNPGWRTYNRFLNSLYDKNTIKYDVAGSIEDVKNITPEELLRVYGDFYTTGNMKLFAIGGIDENQLYDALEKSSSIKSTDCLIERIYPHEGAAAVDEECREEMDVGENMFVMGFKEESMGDGHEAAKKEIMYRIILDYIIGPASELYEELYNQGLIDSTFGYGLNCGKQFAYSIVSGSSKEPENVRNKLLKKIDNIKASGLKEEMFYMLKKKHWGESIRTIDREESFIREIVALYNKNQDWFEALNILDSIDINETNLFLKDIMNRESFSLSVTEPIRSIQI